MTDIWCWNMWSKQIFEFGLGNVYGSGTDYLPLYHYFLKFYSFFQNNPEQIEKNIQYLKLISLFFHFVTGYFLICLIKEGEQNLEKSILNSLFFLLNISILYNSIIWSQVDGILTCFIFISCYFAIRKQILPSIVFFVLAINFKLQAIIFIPIIGLILLPEMFLRFSFIRLIKWIIIPVILQVIILLPFIFTGNVEMVWTVVSGSLGKYPVISMNAFNMWDLLVKGDLMYTEDSIIISGLSYKNWGLLLFFTTSGLALFPLAKSVYLSLRSKTNQVLATDKIMITCSLVTLLFFYVNTQMHERYSHPALVFILAYSILRKKPVLATIGCAAYILNLEVVLQSLRLENYSQFFFQRSFISILYLVCIIWLFLDLFNVKLMRKTFKKPVLVIN